MPAVAIHEAAELIGIQFKNNAGLTAPGAGFTRLYVKTDKKVYYRDDTGVERLISLDLPLALAQGGTGAASASAARTNLGLVIGTDVAAASHTHEAADIASGTLAIARGGTNAGTAAAARTNLGLEIGTDVAAAAHTHAAGDITSGLLAIARGGTNAGTAADARTNLGLEIGTDVAAASHTHAAADIASGVLNNARVNFASPDAIGNTTPNSGAFTTISATDQIGGANGSAGTPSFSWTGDTNTGFYSVSNDVTGYSANGTIRMMMGASGFRLSRGAASPTSAPLAVVDIQRHDSATGTIIEILRLIRTVSGAGVGASGVGGSIALAAETSTSGDLGEIVAQIDYSWNNATHASRLGEMSIAVADVGTLREGLRIRAATGAAQIGFLGASPVSRPTVSGSRVGNAALASLLTALANLGLITDSTSV